MSDETATEHVEQTGRTTCFFCSSKGPLERHHILPKRIGGTDKDRNVVDLCPTCHKRIEQLYDDRVLRELSPHMTGEASSVRWVDHYAAAVLNELSVGGTVTVAALRNLYRKRTRMKNRDTVTDRVKRLIESGLFESADGPRTHRYVGGEE